MLYEFRDRIVLEHKHWWFVWEEAWDMFRPINAIRWDGTAFVFDDREYCMDPSDPLYGFGSQTMKDLCELLGDQRLEELPIDASVLDAGSLEWFFDRRVALTPCAVRDHASWKRMVQGRGRTCRKAPKGEKYTRRRTVYR
jgi:hypothetical protein